MRNGTYFFFTELFLSPFNEGENMKRWFLLDFLRPKRKSGWWFSMHGQVDSRELSALTGCRDEVMIQVDFEAFMQTNYWHVARELKKIILKFFRVKMLLDEKLKKIQIRLNLQQLFNRRLLKDTFDNFTKY